ncbi:MAG TPA: hypothetical protein VKF62_00325, partial [Planctomycetota bacterium]|nr:hypothetical protein [Planctomycetota bacterium]
GEIGNRPLFANGTTSTRTSPHLWTRVNLTATSPKPASVLLLGPTDGFGQVPFLVLNGRARTRRLERDPDPPGRSLRPASSPSPPFERHPQELPSRAQSPGGLNLSA